MRRRDFLQASLLALGSVTQPGSGRTADSAVPKPGGKLHILYARDEVPRFDVPSYRGQSYSDRIPDTLDIAERARLGVHALTSITDPDADYEIYGACHFFRNPPVMDHDFNDWVQQQEGLMEALPLLRLAGGDNLNSQVDPVWMKATLESIGPDGLFYIPLEGRPWARLHADGINPVWKADGTKTDYTDRSVTLAANASSCQRMIGTMTIYYLRDGNPMWLATINKMIERLAALAIYRDDYCYFAPGSFEPNARVPSDAPMPRGSTWGVSWNTRLIQGLMQYYRVSSHEPARVLAEKLVKYTRYHGEIFEPEGPWALDPEIRGEFRSLAVPDSIRTKYPVAGLTRGGHGHGHGIGLIAMFEYADALHDRDLLRFCQAGFEWARNPGMEFGASTRVGWFPEFYVPHYPSCEGCIVGDMLSLAVRLSAAGVGDYWDDVDRWVRNQFAEQQLTSAEWVYRLAAREPHKPVGPFEVADHAPERNIGAYAGGASANDFALGVASSGIGHCCTGTCTRTIYYVWENMVDDRDGQLRVNLLLNRAARRADVYSYIPFQGRVDVKLKEAFREVMVRAPEWLAPQSPQIECRVNGAPRPLAWVGRYVSLGAAQAGDVATLTFPIEERTVHEQIGGAPYTLVIKGNTVVSIDPEGKNVPFYLGRERYRSNQVAWRQVQRFVPEKELVW
jgi:hypothetical protein